MHRTLQAFPCSRLIAVCLSLLLVSPLPLAAEPAQQQAPAPQQLPEAPVPQTQPAVPAVPAQSQTALAQPPLLPGESSSLAQQAPAAQDSDQQNQAQHPVGTAAGPISKPTGVAGARPAGAAIAPGKQRRVKAFFIRASIIVAAAGATGAVIGLSKASPSRP